ncbi:MAG: hypothetical protein ACOX5M_01765 [Bacillota bacterium]
MISFLRYTGTAAGYRKYARPEILKAAMRGYRLSDIGQARKLQQCLVKAAASDARGRYRYTRQNEP